MDATVTAGEGVVLSGTLGYEGEKTGKIRLDILTSRGENPHLLAKTLELSALGEWSVELPKDFGEVNIVGFLDQTGDGPTADDPAAALPAPVAVATEPIEGLALMLVDDADLGALTPGGPPPDADGAPPPTDPAAQAGQDAEPAQQDEPPASPDAPPADEPAPEAPEALEVAPEDGA